MMRTIMISVGVVVLIIAAVFGGMTFTNKMTQKNQEEQKADQAAVANTAATAISQAIADRVQQAGKLASSPELVAQFQSGDAISLAAYADSLTEKIPTALKIRLFLPGTYSVDRESSPPMGYASMDLLRAAEEGDKSLPVEIHNFGSDSAHVVIVKRVTDKDGKLLGLLHISLKPAEYLKIDKQAAAAGGFIELVQQAAGTQLVLARHGDESFKQGNPVTSHIDGTLWQIRYWPRSGFSMTTDSSNGGLPVIPIAVVALVLLIIAFFLIRKFRASPDKETDTDDSNVIFGGAIKAIQDGLHPGLEKLIPNLPGLGQKKPVEPVSQGMEGEDITRAIKPGEVAKKMQEAANKTPPARKADTGKQAPPKKPAAAEEPASEPDTEKGDEQAAADETVEIPAVIFRAYDIRGVVGKTLNAAIVKKIGAAIGAEALKRDQKGIVVGHDGRNSSNELVAALIDGLRGSGVDVIDIGMVPTPVLYFATHHLETDSGVMVTGSHNGPEYNGLKIVLDGETLSGDAIQAIRQRLEADDLPSGRGSLQTADIMADYIRRASEDIPVALGGAFKVVVDCGNGVAGMTAPQLFRALGHDVVELYCEVDGNFPNHHPDPSQPENLQDLIAKVRETEADIGLAFDGDGDRLGVVDSEGNIIWPDRQMMLFAKDVLSRNAGKPIIFDVKCSRYLKAIIEMSGGKPVMWKTGHSLIKNKMKEIDAPLAGEMSGHIFFKERWYGFDDGLYAGARLLEILTASKEKPSGVFADLPGGIATPELRVPLPEKYHGKFMQALKKKAVFDGADITDIDGLRVDFSDRWGLIRPSNTSPCLIVRFEAEDESSLEKIKTEFRELIQSVTKDLKLPF